MTQLVDDIADSLETRSVLRKVFEELIQTADKKKNPEIILISGLFFFRTTSSILPD